jgi:hypothetical protein
MKESKDLVVKLDAEPAAEYLFSPLKERTPLQRAIDKSWTGGR